VGIARYRKPPPGVAELPSEREVLAAAERIRAAEGVPTFGRRERKKALEVQRFGEQIAFALRGAPRSRPLTILDGACGKSYLSFVARLLLLPRLGLRARIVGVDEVAGRLDTCRTIARNLELEDMEFHAGRLGDVDLPPRIDVAWALHACGEATDQFLARAVRARVRWVLCVPCCHRRIDRGFDDLGLPLTGRIRTRVGDALLDAARFLRLEAAGYRVDAVEFAGGDVTPRNLMLRAERTASGRSPSDAAARLAKLTAAFPELRRAD
jgi:hypothetical protein